MDDYSFIYFRQIEKAQEFLDSNHNADVSRLQCLLRMMMPESCYDRIDNIREHPPGQTYNISDGEHIIAPNAKVVYRTVVANEHKQPEPQPTLRHAFRTLLKAFLSLL